MRWAAPAEGWSTKIHQLVDGRGRPLVIAVTPGQAGDSPMLQPLLAHKQWRGLATRYDKLAVVYRGGVALRAITIWLANKETRPSSTHTTTRGPAVRPGPSFACSESWSAGS